MQQRHYSAAELSGDPSFPSHLTARQAIKLIVSHDHSAVLTGTEIVAGCYATDRDGNRFTEISRFKPTDCGLYRASAILCWLGY